MINPFNLKSRPVPILTPLAKGNFWRRAQARFGRLPPAVAPIAVTLIGGLVIVFLFGALMGRETPATDAGETASIGNEIAVTEANAAPMAEAEVEKVMTEPVAAAATDEQQEVVETVSAAPTPVQPGDAGQNLEPTTADNDQSAPGMDNGTQSDVVAVAETADEIFALEEIQRREVEADVGPPSNEITAAIPPAAGPKVAAIATKWVNMRAGPSDDAEILTVVPALANIVAESDCGWCAVRYDGREGYIYKNFISYE